MPTSRHKMQPTAAARMGNETRYPVIAQARRIALAARGRNTNATSPYRVAPPRPGQRHEYHLIGPLKIDCDPYDKCGYQYACTNYSPEKNLSHWNSYARTADLNLS